MKKTGYLLIVVMGMIACTQNPGQNNNLTDEKQAIAKTDSVRDGVFIHLTESYNDPHRVLMPMKMATIMANDKDVIVYLDIHAVELLVKGSKDLTFDGFESFQKYLKQMIDKKVGIYACPTCLKIAGFNPEDLMDGVQIADKDKFFNFTKGRILTLDY